MKTLILLVVWVGSMIPLISEAQEVPLASIEIGDPYPSDKEIIEGEHCLLWLDYINTNWNKLEDTSSDTAVMTDNIVKGQTAFSSAIQADKKYDFSFTALPRCIFEIDTGGMYWMKKIMPSFEEAAY